MRDLSIKEVSDLICEKLEVLKYELVLTNPTTESVFPCLELHTPLKSVNKTHNPFTIKSTFQVSITCYDKKQRKCMEMTNEAEEVLREMNFCRINTSPSIFDPITKKYGITATFEVRYNGIMNSFDFIK